MNKCSHLAQPYIISKQGALFFLVFAVPDVISRILRRQSTDLYTSELSDSAEKGSGIKKLNNATLRYLRTLPQIPKPQIVEDSSKTEPADPALTSVDLAITQFDTASLNLASDEEAPLRPHLPDPLVLDRDMFDVLEVDMNKLREELVGLAGDELEHFDDIMSDMDSVQQENLQRHIYNRRKSSLRRVSNIAPREGEYMSMEDELYAFRQRNSFTRVSSSSSLNAGRSSARMSYRPSAEYLQTDGLFSRGTSLHSIHSSQISDNLSGGRASGSSSGTSSSTAKRLAAISETQNVENDEIVPPTDEDIDPQTPNDVNKAEQEMELPNDSTITEESVLQRHSEPSLHSDKPIPKENLEDMETVASINGDSPAMNETSIMPTVDDGTIPSFSHHQHDFSSSDLSQGSQRSRDHDSDEEKFDGQDPVAENIDDYDSNSSNIGKRVSTTADEEFAGMFSLLQTIQEKLGGGAEEEDTDTKEKKESERADIQEEEEKEEEKDQENKDKEDKVNGDVHHAADRENEQVEPQQQSKDTGSIPAVAYF